MSTESAIALGVVLYLLTQGKRKPPPPPPPPPESKAPQQSRSMANELKAAADACTAGASVGGVVGGVVAGPPGAAAGTAVGCAAGVVIEVITTHWDPIKDAVGCFFLGCRAGEDREGNPR